ncbi:4-hydroxy-tetrahydrodipicolinate reductase [soil metagenome]
MVANTPLRFGLVGISGRMGREIVALAAIDRLLKVVGGIGSRNAGELRDLASNCDVLIDFSTPEFSATAASAGAESGTPIVVGTTGLVADQVALLRATSVRAPVWFARNISAGVSLLQRLLPEIARALERYDIELIEAHRWHKVDAPSGTALMSAEANIAGLPGADEHPLVQGREGHAPRQPGEIGIHAVRSGGKAGEHAILFASNEEEIRITHRAYSRQAFAAGAIRAARAIHGQPPGWYGPE